MWNTVDGKHNLFGNGSILFFFRVFNTASELFWTRVVTQFFCHTVYTHLFGSNFLTITLVCLRYPLCSVACCCHFSVLLDMFLPFETAENNCRRNRGKALWSELFEPENNELSCCEVFFFSFYSMRGPESFLRSWFTVTMQYLPLKRHDRIWHLLGSTFLYVPCIWTLIFA